MITNDMLTADAVLTGLTDEQKDAIVAMSKNDEEVVIGNRFREVYNQLDATIAKETGIARNGDEKTYVYLERAARELATKAKGADGLQTKVSELTKERDRLQKALNEGGADEQLKKQLSQAQKDLEGVRKEYTTLKGEYDTKMKEHASEVMMIRVDNELQQARAGIRLKEGLPQAAIDQLVTGALSKVKGMNPDFIDDGQGGHRLVFKNEQGETMRNPEKQLEPYSAADLLVKELKAVGILDEGRKQEGSGTKPPQGGGGSGAPVDVSQARTQTEAQDIIARQLMKQGMVNGSKAFQEAMTKAWKDNNISALPIN